LGNIYTKVPVIAQEVESALIGWEQRKELKAAEGEQARSVSTTIIAYSLY